MRERTAGTMATAAGIAVLAGLLTGGTGAVAAAVSAAVLTPTLLLALAGGGDPRVRRSVAVALGLVLALGAAGVLVLFPGSTAWMLLSLCLAPWLVAAFGFAAAHRDPEG